MDKDREANHIQPGLQPILLIEYSRSLVRPPEWLLNAIFFLRKLGAAHSSQTAELEIRYKYARARELGGGAHSSDCSARPVRETNQKKLAGPPRAA